MTVRISDLICKDTTAGRTTNKREKSLCYTEGDIKGNFQAVSKDWFIPDTCTMIPDNPLTCRTKASPPLSLYFNLLPLNSLIAISKLNLNFKAMDNSTSARSRVRELTPLQLEISFFSLRGKTSFLPKSTHRAQVCGPRRSDSLWKQSGIREPELPLQRDVAHWEGF